METVSNKVIIWGNDNFNTLGLVRQIGKYNIDLLFLINGKAGIASRSAYNKTIIETNGVEDGFKYLEQNRGEYSLKPIIIVSSDEVMVYLDEHRAIIEDDYILPGTKESGLTTKLIDKNNITTLAIENGILCPKSKIIKKDSDISDIGYPCIIKPAHETPGYFNEFKYRVCKNRKALVKTLKLVRIESEFIVQDLIEKENDVLIYGCRMRNGETKFAGAFIKDRWDDSGSGSHGVVTSDIPGCVDTEAICRLINNVDYFGLFSVEYALKQNKAFFYEINFRNDGTSHFFFQAGANLPLAYIYSCAGLSYEEIRTSVTDKWIMIDEILDIENVIHFRIRCKEYKKDLKEARIFKYYDEEDKEPWKEMKHNRIKIIIKDLVVKKARPYIVYFGSKMGLRK